MIPSAEHRIRVTSSAAGLAFGPPDIDNESMIDEDATSGIPVRPRCPICGHEKFGFEKGKIDSEWGVTAHRVDILICERCGNVLLFYEGRTIFDFD